MMDGFCSEPKVPGKSFVFFSSRRRHTSCGRDWSSDVCSSDLRETEPTRTILLAIEDITPRRQAERELRASEEVRYRRLFETAKDGIVLVDADTGQITNVNPAWTALTGRDTPDLLGRRLWESGSFEDPETVRGLVRQ